MSTLRHSVFLLPLPSPPFSLSFWSRVGRFVVEVALMCGSLLLSAQLILRVLPVLLPHSITEVSLNLAVVYVSITLYASLALLFHRYFPPPPLLSPPTPRLPFLPGVLLCFSLVSVLGFTTSLFATSAREDPLILQRVLSIPLHPSHFLAIGLLGPIGEELLFRGLFFARLCPIIGVVPAYAASSLFFGMLHWSPESSKIVDCVVTGVPLALAYRLTLSLAAPALLHALNNGLLAALCFTVSPVQSDAVLDRSLRLCLGVGEVWENGMWRVKRLLPEQLQQRGVWGTVDTAPLVRDMFRVLDRGHKGHLSAEEAAFFFTLDTGLLDFLAAAFLVLQTDIPRMSPSAAAPYAALLSSSVPSPAPSLPLPSRHFLASPSPQQVKAISDLYEAFTSPPLSALDSSAMKPTALLTDLSHSISISPSHLTQALILRYYRKVMAVINHSLGVQDGRLEREKFVELCDRMALTAPAQLQELMRRATSIAMGAQPHPLAALGVQERREA